MAVQLSPLWIAVSLIMFALGFRWAVMRRADADHQRTKEALPGLRSAYWRGFWAMVRAVGLVLVVVLVLSWHDFGHGEGSPASWLRNLVPAGVGDGKAPNGDVICFSAKCREQNPEHPRN
jgi:protein-S-isoprenylcysteine O-methyltransferase Ste14